MLYEVITKEISVIMKNTKMMVFGFISAAAISVALSTTLLAKTDTSKASEVSIEESRLQSLAKFTKVLSIVEQYNVDNLTIDQLIDKSLQGMRNNFV